MTFRFLSFVLLMFGMMWANSARAEKPPPIIVNEVSGTLRLTDQMAVLTDQTASLTWSDVLSAPADHFRVVTTASGGFLSDAQWRVFDLANTGPAAEERLIQVEREFLNYVDLFIVDEQGTVQQFQAGNRRPVSVRPFANRTFEFPVTIPPHETRHVLVRVQSASALVVDVTLWPVADFIHVSNQESLMQGFLHGMALIVILFTALLAASIRHRSLTWFLIHCSFFEIRLLAVSGYLNTLILPHYPIVATAIGNFSSGMALSAGFMFVAEVLELRRHQPILSKVFTGLAVICLVLGSTVVIDRFDLAAPAMNGAALVYGLACPLVTLRYLRRGHPVAGLLIASMSVSLVALLTRVGRNLGLPIHNNTVEWSLQFGFVCYFMLIAIAVIRHIKRQDSDKLVQTQLLLDSTANRESVLNQLVEHRTAELKRSHDELALAKEWAETALTRETEAKNQLQQFLSMINHEFKTPLAIIDSAAQMLMLHAHQLASVDQSRLTSIRDGVRRLVDLIDTCLANEQLELGHMVMQGQMVDIYPLLQTVLTHHRELVKDRQLDLHCSNLPPIWADPKLLALVFDNLIGNAVKYSQRGPIKVDAHFADQMVIVTVRDFGFGIPAEDISRIFDRYFRARNAHRIAGSGVGLHLVRKIVDLHHGTVDVISRETEGTTFILNLRITPAGT